MCPHELSRVDRLKGAWVIVYPPRSKERAARSPVVLAKSRMSAWLLGACVVAAAEFGSGITQSTCKHTCASANDGACDDGGLGATSDRCDYGMDCAGGALPSYADTPTNPLPHHATYTMRPLTPVNVRPLLPNADCGARDNFECSGPRDAGELRAALLGPGSGYDKQTRPKVALKRAQSSAGAGFWPPERDEAWAQLRILSIDNVDTKTQKVGLTTAALMAALTASSFTTTTSSFTITSTVTSTTFSLHHHIHHPHRRPRR